VDGDPQKVIQSILPPEVRVDQVHFKFLEYLKNVKQSQLGLVDLGNLQAMKMNIANDTADKLIESIGPIAKGIAARIEKGNKAVGYRMKFLILQWFNASRIMEYVGPDSMAREVFDYRPNEMVPSHMPDELVDGKYPTTASQYDTLTRARWFSRQIRLTSVPSTLLKITQMQRQLMMLQLKRTGAPISWATVMKNLDIPNYGDVPGNTEREKWFNEQVEMTKLQIMAQAAAQQFMQQLGIQPPGGDDQGGGGGKGGGGKKGGGNGGAGGRPPSGQKPPRIKQKGGEGGEPRTTITES
jgi:hypothetical protein